MPDAHLLSSQIFDREADPRPPIRKSETKSAPRERFRTSAFSQSEGDPAAPEISFPFTCSSTTRSSLHFVRDAILGKSFFSYHSHSRPRFCIRAFPSPRSRSFVLHHLLSAQLVMQPSRQQVSSYRKTPQSKRSTCFGTSGSCSLVFFSCVPCFAVFRASLSSLP